MAVDLSGMSKGGHAMTRYGHYSLCGENPPKSTYYEQASSVGVNSLTPLVPLSVTKSDLDEGICYTL